MDLALILVSPPSVELLKALLVVVVVLLFRKDIASLLRASASFLSDLKTIKVAKFIQLESVERRVEAAHHQVQNFTYDQQKRLDYVGDSVEELLAGSKEVDNILDKAVQRLRSYLSTQAQADSELLDILDTFDTLLQANHQQLAALSEIDMNIRDMRFGLPARESDIERMFEGALLALRSGLYVKHRDESRLESES